MMGYWVNFATTGNPNASGLPPWPVYDDRDVVQILGVSIAARVNPHADRFGFLGSFRKDGVLPMRWRA